MRRFVKATTLGFLAYRNQRKLALPIMRRYLKLDVQFAEQVYDYSRPSLTSDGTISEELMRTIIETQRERRRYRALSIRKRSSIFPSSGKL